MIAEFVKNQISGSGFISLIARAEHAAGQAFVRAGRKSAVVHTFGPLFARLDLLGEKRKDSFFCALAAKLYAIVLTVVRAVYTGISRVPGLRFITTAADALLKLRLCDISAVLLAAMLCIYHDRWNNGYMLLAAIFLAALYLLRACKGERPEARLPASLYLFLLVSVAVIPITGASIGENLRVYIYFLTAFAFFFVLAGSVENTEDLRRVLMILYIAVLYNSFLAIIQSHYGVPINKSYTDMETNPDMPGRIYASFYNPNNFAEILVLLIPGCFAAWITAPRLTKAAKAVMGLSFILPILALVFTYSRSAWISFALTVAASVGLMNVALIPVALVLVIVAIPFLPQGIKSRFLSLFSGTDTSVSYRMLIWQGCRDMMGESPLGGIGLGPNNFYDVYSRFMSEDAMQAPHSHNLFWEIWFEFGAVGFLSYIGFYLATMKSTLLCALRRGTENRVFSIALFSTMFGMLFISLVEYVWFYPRTMLCFFTILGLMWALVRIAAKEAKA